MIRPAATLISVACLSSPLMAQTTFSSVTDEEYAIITHFFSVDSTAPLNATVSFERRTYGFPTEEIVFTAAKGARARAFLVTPQDPGVPIPVVILVHGLTGEKENWFSESSFERGWLLARSLLERGVAVFAMDARLHGDRLFENDFQYPWNLYTGGEWTRLRDVIVETAADHRRALQYLRSRPEIDESRIAVVGYSMGGVVAYALAALEPVAAMVGAAVWTVDIGDFAFPTDFDARAIATHTFAPRISGVPVLLLMSTQDPNYSVAQAHELADLTATAALKVYEGNHRLPSEYADDAAKWLVELLRREADRNQ